MKVGVIGSGTMGSGIAQVALLAGSEVVLFDLNENAITAARENLISGLKKLTEKGKLADHVRMERLHSISYVTSLKDLADCNLVIEAIVENTDLKKSVFTDIESIISKETILATNTSSISITSLASALRIPERFIGVHFFNPAFLMPLVEVIPGLRTDKALVDKTTELMKSWGKYPVTAKDTPGFIVNRIARPFYGEALKIFEENIATVHEIDSVMKMEGGFKMGPFELMDLIGIDVNYAVTETVWQQFYFDARYKPSFTQKRMVEAGFFGRKSGVGFYNYKTPAEENKSPKSESSYSIFYRILCMLINEAAEAHYLGIASREDIETAMMKGVNYPKGLLHWCDEIGAETVYQTLLQLKNDYQDDRYKPCILLKRMAENQEKFF